MLIPLEELGNKICIIGCSSSGKSTLADKLSKKLSIPVTHLDLLAHYPNTNWKRKPDNELIDAHRKVIEGDEWIIEGNYSICMKERFSKATAIIWLDPKPLGSVLRYIKRSLISSKGRVGNLPGSRKEFSFWLIKHILFTYPKNRLKYQEILNTIDVQVIKITSMRELEEVFQYWRLPL